MKIHKIELENYRGFYGKHELNPKGKNMLIYGENGSGKSSLFVALKQFLRTSLDGKEIGGFLDEIHENTIPGSESKVELFFKNPSSENKYSSINSNHKESFIQEAAKVRSLLSYKNVVRMYLDQKGTDIISNEDKDNSEKEFGEFFFRLMVENIWANYEIKGIDESLVSFWNGYKSINDAN